MVGRARLFSGNAARLIGAGCIFVLGMLAGVALGPVPPVRGTELPSVTPAVRSGSSGSESSGTLATPSRSAAASARLEQSAFWLRGQHPAAVTRVVDGDTFEARVHVWPGIDITTLVRLRGIDAPEFKARCMEERVKAEAARERLQTLLDQGDVFVSQVEFDKYGGRVLAAAATRRTPDVSAALLQAGLARRYEGGRRDGWCS
jgi:endonuclease YncB( thermonuclease family)